MANLGSITVNEIEIIEVDVSPRVSGVDASIGSLAILTDGSFIFLKTTASSTGWVPVFLDYTYSIGTANQNSTSTTYANVTELTSEILPVGLYTFECFALCQSTAANTGVGLRLGAGTAVLSTTFGRWEISQAVDGISKTFIYDQLSATTNVTSASVNTINTNFVVIGRGIFEVTTSGTVAVQIRSETGTSVSIRIGSNFNLRKLS